MIAQSKNIFATNYGWISSPSQEISLPESDGLAVSIIFFSCTTLYSGVNKLPSFTFLLKGSLNSLSTVPGCRPKIKAFGLVLLNSILKFLMIWLSAVLLAL